MPDHLPFTYDDGGRAAAGFKGTAGDCVTRAVAIASGRRYADVYAALAEVTASERPRSGRRAGRTARNGILVRRPAFKRYMESLGFTWTPTMKIGSGCKVHLCAGELPYGRLVVQVSKHYVAVVDGVIRDTWDPQRTTLWYNGTNPDGSARIARMSERCVYGYWTYQER